MSARIDWVDACNAVLPNRDYWIHQLDSAAVDAQDITKTRSNGEAL